MTRATQAARTAAQLREAAQEVARLAALRGCIGDLGRGQAIPDRGGPAAERNAAAGATETDAIEMLRRNWGEAYEIGCNDGEWWYRRRDGLGERETTQNANALHKLIIEDYTFRPVRPETP